MAMGLWRIFCGILNSHVFSRFYGFWLLTIHVCLVIMDFGTKSELKHQF